MTITDERLKEIAETVFEDPDDMSTALNHLAVALLERKVPTQTPKPSAPPETRGRVPGKPVDEKKLTTCSKCGADVAIFISKRTTRPYYCDAEMGYFGNRRTMLSGPNWLHDCAGAR